MGVFGGVYGPSDDSARNDMWVELDSMRLQWISAWCLIGDFNIIIYLVEKLGCNSFSSAMSKFSDFIEKHNLVDLPLEGGDYTWFRDSNNPSMSRIDRALISTDWEDHFLDVTQKSLPQVVSDPCPILVEAGGMLRGTSAFKFENMWLKVVDRVQQWWRGYHFVGPPSYVLACKLKALKGDLKHWNKHVFGDVAFRKKCLLTEFLELDMREELQVLSLENRSRRTMIKADIEHLASLEEISWRQKSKALFIKEGDNNTRFFHRLANSHRRTNQIRGMEVEGVLYEDDRDVQAQVVEFYKNLYQEPESWRPTIDGLEFACLDES